MRGETGVAPFLSARLGGLSDGGGVVDGCGQEVCRGRGGGVIRMSLLFFSCLSYRIRPGEAASARLVEASRFSSRLASRLFRLGVRLVGTSRFLSCERLVMASRRGGGAGAFRFLSLRFARVHDRWLVSSLLSRVSLRPSARLIRPVFFLSSSERVARRGAGRSARVGVLFPSCGEGVLFPHYDWPGGERGRGER